MKMPLELKLVDDPPPRASAPADVRLEPAPEPFAPELKLSLVDDAAHVADKTPSEDGASDTGVPMIDVLGVEESAHLRAAHPPGSNETTPAAAAAPLAQASSAERFLAEAQVEYEKGRIDQLLWDHVMAQVGGDKDLGLQAYLRARATALRLAKRNKRSDMLERRARAVESVTKENGDADADIEPPRRPTLDRRHIAIAAAAVLVVVAIAAWMTMGRGDDSPTPVATRSAQSRATDKAAAQAQVERQQAARAEAAAAEAKARNLQFQTKVRELSDAGNWNVMVLHAVEWTRSDPGNAAAWNQLSLGFTNLRQYEDAFEAAKKAIAVAPNDPASWRNFAQANLAVKDPQGALVAFEHAVSLDDHDVHSLVQAGALHAQLGQFAQAKLAFDQALALNPESADAMCGQVLIAQRQGRSKDADAMARQLKTGDGKCSDFIAASTAAVAPPVAAAPSASPAKGPAAKGSMAQASSTPQRR